jgi:hypothetical protein
MTQAEIDAATAAFYIALEKEDLTDVQRQLVRGIVKRLVSHAQTGGHAPLIKSKC